MNNKNTQKRGRPTKEIKRDADIRVRMTSDLKDRLRTFAKNNGFNMSQVVEMALESFMFEDIE